MKCKICQSENTTKIYDGPIRNGALGHYTDRSVAMYQCSICKSIFHEPYFENIENYYESKEYRDLMGEGSDADTFYSLHDKETLDKLKYTGTTIFRGKNVADIGCGCGAFLDFIKGVAKNVIAIEPSEAYRKIMDKKGFRTYDYTSSARKFGGGSEHRYHYIF